MHPLKDKLDELAQIQNGPSGLFAAADPLQIAKKYGDDFIALLCALFAYGNAKNIVNFLSKLDFSLLNSSEKQIQKKLKNIKYRFQSEEDVRQIFITLSRLKKESSLEELFAKPYLKKFEVSEGIKNFIQEIYKINPYRSKGYEFFFGKIWRYSPTSPLKRYNMFLRWMVRQDALDMGLWSQIHSKDLLIPLDTHTHKTALILGLLKRRSYDFKSVLELTNKLKEFDPKDPIKYDFALYRLGQSKEINFIK